MKANGAAAAADATADAARPLHTHPSLRPPSSSRQPGEPVGAKGSRREGRLVGGPRRPGLAKWSEGVSEEAVGEGGGGRDAAATRVMRGARLRSRQDGRKERYVCPWPGCVGPKGGAQCAGVWCSSFSCGVCAGTGGVVICVCVSHCVSLSVLVCFWVCIFLCLLWCSVCVCVCLFGYTLPPFDTHPEIGHRAAHQGPG